MHVTCDGVTSHVHYRQRLGQSNQNKDTQTELDDDLLLSDLTNKVTTHSCQTSHTCYIHSTLQRKITYITETNTFHSSLCGYHNIGIRVEALIIRL